MNKNYFALILLLLISINTFRQVKKATVFYKNGDSIQGYVNRIVYDDIEFSK